MNGFQLKVLKKARYKDGNLTDFEKSFVTDLSSKDVRYDLSEKQNHILNKISEKVYR